MSPALESAEALGRAAQALALALDEAGHASAATAARMAAELLREGVERLPGTGLADGGGAR